MVSVKDMDENILVVSENGYGKRSSLEDYRLTNRGGKGVNLLIGVIVFMLYYNGLLVTKRAIELGQINPIIGLWGVHLFMVLLIFLLYRFRHGRMPSYLDKISHLQLKEKKHD